MTQRSVSTTGRRRFFLAPFLLAALVLTTVTSGCGPTSGGLNRQLMLILILDETRSFRRHWSASVFQAARTVAQLRPGDSLVVLGLDDHAWDEDDVRVPLTVLPTSMLQAAQARAGLVARIQNLKPRPGSSGATDAKGVLRGGLPGTDTLGILDFASHLAQRADGRAVRLAAFSDFEDEPAPHPGGRRHPASFPAHTAFTALYVGAHGGEEASRRIKRWCDTLGGMGVACTPGAFLLEGETAQVRLAARPGK